MSTGSTLKLNDSDLIKDKVNSRLSQHTPSAKSKARGKTEIIKSDCKKGDIVYLYSDRDKSKARDKYLVVDEDENYVTTQKFTGLQFRSRKYRVKPTDIITVPSKQLPTNENAQPEILPSIIPSTQRKQPVHTRTPVSCNQKSNTSTVASDDSDDELTYSDLLPPQYRGSHQNRAPLTGL